jgi:hypothetical protein
LDQLLKTPVARLESAIKDCSFQRDAKASRLINGVYLCMARNAVVVLVRIMGPDGAPQAEFRPLINAVQGPMHRAVVSRGQYSIAAYNYRSYLARIAR